MMEALEPLVSVHEMGMHSPERLRLSPVSNLMMNLQTINFASTITSPAANTVSSRTRRKLPLETTTGFSAPQTPSAHSPQENTSFFSPPKTDSTNEDQPAPQCSPYKTPKHTRIAPLGDLSNLSGGRTPLRRSASVLFERPPRGWDEESTPSLAPRISGGHSLTPKQSPPPSEHTTAVVDHPPFEPIPELPLMPHESTSTTTKLPSSQERGMSCISTATVAEVVSGKYPGLNYLIIDCRFPFEFEGGHIKGAINICDDKLIKERFIDAPQTETELVLIFHCEFSSVRGPSSLQFLRRLDREINMYRYPRLFYPEIYLMSGGYRDFYALHKEMCEGEYIEMNNKRFAPECKAYEKLRKQFKRARSASAGNLFNR